MKLLSCLSQNCIRLGQIGFLLLMVSIGPVSAEQNPPPALQPQKSVNNYGPMADGDFKSAHTGLSAKPGRDAANARNATRQHSPIIVYRMPSRADFVESLLVPESESRKIARTAYTEKQTLRLVRVQSATAPDVKSKKPTKKSGVKRKGPSTSVLTTAQQRRGSFGPGDVPCGNGYPRNLKGNCPDIPRCARQCSWSIRKGEPHSCWTTQGKNIVVGYSDQKTPDGKQCAWVRK